ncbi:MAG: outer membrane lipoprotein-sorting protein [Firmicutes bacterium]|nr:outer membrane lipoprotein-sorting protein [Bacillota bacterium]
MQMKWKISILFLAAAIGLSAFYGPQAAAAFEPDGDTVITKVDAAMHSDSKIMSEEMVITNAAGHQRTRTIQAWNKVSAAGDHMLVRFLNPADVAGTAFLMSGDDMWLYLPALGKVRRIAGHARKGNFMGSDLSYEDMESLGSSGFASDYDARLLGHGEEADEVVYLLELTPRAQDASYGKLNMWVSQQTFLPRRLEYYDGDGKLLKVLTTHNIRANQGRWVAGQMKMENIQTGTKTALTVTDVEFDVDIDDSIFTTRHLERGR